MMNTTKKIVMSKLVLSGLLREEDDLKCVSCKTSIIKYWQNPSDGYTHIHC